MHNNNEFQDQIRIYTYDEKKPIKKYYAPFILCVILVILLIIFVIGMSILSRFRIK